MKQKPKKRLLAALLCGVITAATLTGCGTGNTKEFKKSSDGTSTTQTSQSSTPQQRVLEGEDAVKSEHYTLSKQLVAYLYNNYYTQYRTKQREYLTMMGLDVTKSLKEQYYNTDNTLTWYDYFMDMTKQYLTQLLVLCEAAKEEGMELSEEDKSKVETTVNSIKTSAKTNNMSVDEFIQQEFGEGVTEEEISQYLEMTAISTRYRENLYNSYKYTEEQYEKHYQDNKTSYLYADFLTFKLNFSTSGDTSDGSSAPAADPELKAQAKSIADSLAKSKTPQAFKAALKKYYSENRQLLPTSEGQTMTEDEINELIDKQVEAAQIKKQPYEVTSPDTKWIFDASRENYDTTVLESDTAYTVIMVTKTAYRDESLYKNVRHILVTSNQYDGNEGKARSRAEEIYDEWKKGDATEESFAALAQLYSEDPGSSSNGGLYTDVGEGVMVAEFNDWLFDSDRKVGDTDIIKSTYGYHIMYFCGNGEVVWKKSVDTVLRKNDYAGDYEKLLEKYEIIFDDVYLNTIEEVPPINETSEASQTSTQESSQTSQQESSKTSSEASKQTSKEESRQTSPEASKQASKASSGT